MGYYMRYLVTDSKQVNLNVLESALKQASPLFSIAASESEQGELRFGSDIYGIVEVDRSGSPDFNSEVEELAEQVEEAEAEDKDMVLNAIEATRTIVAVEVLWGKRTTEETLSKLDPLWNWLQANHTGLLQADGEGYYKNRKLILKVE